MFVYINVLQILQCTKAKQSVIMIHDFRFFINSLMKIIFVVIVFMTALNETAAQLRIVRPFESSGRPD